MLIKLTEKLYFTSGYKHQVKYPFHVFIPGLVKYGNVDYDFVQLRNGYLEIFPGFGWDGASGLTFDTMSSFRGSLVHDVLYRLIRQGLLPVEIKELADDILEFVCVNDKMWKWRAGMWHYAVDKHGDASVDPRNKIKVRVTRGD